MKDSLTNLGFLYGHMRDPSVLNVGDNVSYGTFVGYEGSTGNSTGNHVHIQCLDMTNLNNWVFGLPISDYVNPCNYLGIPNTTGTRVYYSGTPQPIYSRKNKFPWVLYARKLRNRGRR